MRLKKEHKLEMIVAR